MPIYFRFVFTLVASLAVGVQAADSPFAQSSLGNLTQRLFASQWNQGHSVRPRVDWPVQRPFSEIEETGFVALSGDDEFEMASLREAIAKNLPADVTLIVYTSDSSIAADLQEKYKAYLGADRLKFVTVPYGGDQFWARDSLPFPVYLQPAAGSTAPKFGLVASHYPQDFDPNAAFAKALSLPMVQDGQYFRGGNLLFDLQGNCFAENYNEVPDLSDPQSFFKTYYGCSSVTLLDYTSGKGDIDERVKFLTGNKVLTDNASYAQVFTSKGYEVHMIPGTGNPGETYMNTLLVNGTIFVPQMGLSSDSAALKAYQDLGFKPIGVYTKTMADDGDGNIHCVTMNYPKGSITF